MFDCTMPPDALDEAAYEALCEAWRDSRPGRNLFEAALEEAVETYGAQLEGTPDGTALYFENATLWCPGTSTDPCAYGVTHPVVEFEDGRVWPVC